jgi:hypothetical protein
MVVPIAAVEWQPYVAHAWIYLIDIEIGLTPAELA